MRATVTVAIVAMVLIAGCAGAAAPDTILVNGKVFTSNPAQPWAEAVAIRGDRVIAVGDTAAIAALAGSSTSRLDAGGRTIIPGINDAHQHVGIAPPSRPARAADGSDDRSDRRGNRRADHDVAGRPA